MTEQTINELTNFFQQFKQGELGKYFKIVKI